LTSSTNHEKVIESFEEAQTVLFNFGFDVERDDLIEANVQIGVDNYITAYDKIEALARKRGVIN
jgi:PleD family two-component response regulator